MEYALENAVTQWQEGERRVRETPEPAAAALDRACALVQEELRRRLGSAFSVGELAELYASGTDWAEELARRSSGGTDAAVVVDAAFCRYAQQAVDFAGGRPRHPAPG